MKRTLLGKRILLADDHAMVRLGFRALLEGEGCAIVGEADAGESALRCHAELQPDLLIMDVSMPGMGGLGALERLRSTQPQARILMLSAHHDEVIPVRALRLGASGYLCKRAMPEEFLKAVATVLRGERYIDPELASMLALAQFSGAANPLESLTERELAVFLKLAMGRTVNEIAEQFCLGQSTVGTHLYHIKQKLNVRNVAEMTLVALRARLLEA
ncbi:MAG: response regulator transcription factor [Dechloromonas sp.]|nr:response regulator transcription factor [Dechloromonas sp.]